MAALIFVFAYLAVTLIVGIVLKDPIIAQLMYSCIALLILGGLLTILWITLRRVNKVLKQLVKANFIVTEDRQIKIYIYALAIYFISGLLGYIVFYSFEFSGVDSLKVLYICAYINAVELFIF